MLFDYTLDLSKKIWNEGCPAQIGDNFNFNTLQLWENAQNHNSLNKKLNFSRDWFIVSHKTCIFWFCSVVKHTFF